MDSNNNEATVELVTPKELIVEEYLQEIFESLPRPDHVSGVELARIWKEEIRERISNESVTLSHKTSPLVQIMLEQKIKAIIDESFAKVAPQVQDVKAMTNNYTSCFNEWIDCESHVSFQTPNTSLLGKVSMKDAWILTFFAFCTCQRTKNDNILMLGLVGCSTSGKSTLFESILMEGSHVTTNERGVGRFTTDNKPVLLFHDIDIRTLVVGPDVEKIKAIARTETAIAKIHSGTLTISSMFVFYSSNERLMNHQFQINSSNPKALFRIAKYHSQVNKSNKKKVCEEHLKAVQNRFIECFVKERPKINTEKLPKFGGFQRIHGIFGMFERIIAILKQYNSDDFNSPYLYLYALKGMCLYAEKYNKAMECDIKPIILEQVFRLVSPHLIESVTKDL